MGLCHPSRICSTHEIQLPPLSKANDSKIVTINHETPVSVAHNVQSDEEHCWDWIIQREKIH